MMTILSTPLRLLNFDKTSGGSNWTGIVPGLDELGFLVGRDGKGRFGDILRLQSGNGNCVD